MILFSNFWWEWHKTHIGCKTKGSSFVPINRGVLFLFYLSQFARCLSYFGISLGQQILWSLFYHVCLCFSYSLIFLGPGIYFWFWSFSRKLQCLFYLSIFLFLYYCWYFLKEVLGWTMKLRFPTSGIMSKVYSMH